MAEPSIKDIAYRTAASVFGGPVDLATMVMRPFGYKTPDTQVMGGSEWIGKKMEEAGLVSSARAPLTEFIASVAVPTPGGIAKGAALAAPAIGGMFIGKGARTWDALAAQKAKLLADMGIDPRTIWQQTGTWKGPDGKWRQEIDDSSAMMKTGTPLPQTSINGELHPDFKVKDAMRHDPLFAAYPSTAEIQQSFMSGRGNMGEYRPGMDWISLDKRYSQQIQSESGAESVKAAQKALDEFSQRPRVQKYDKLLDQVADKYGFGERMDKTIQRFGIGIERERESLVKKLLDAKQLANERAMGTGITNDAKTTQLHELQHAIQQREGFAKGGGINEFTSDMDALAKLNNMSYSEMDDFQKAMYLDLRKKYKSAKTPEQAYNNLAGEAEARAVQSRMNMTPAQRRATFPEESYDVPLNELIIRTD